MFKLLFTLIFADRFCSHFKARSFTNRSKSWILPSNNVHYQFCFISPKRCFKICDLSLKLTWKCYWSSCFRGSCSGRKTFFTRKFWELCTHWSSILRPPKHWIVFFPFYFKAKSSNLSLLGVKTRPWKFLDLTRKRTGRKLAEGPQANSPTLVV